jgi:hypothetical protein
MKISKHTISLLKNFATINASIAVREGNTLKTLSPGNNIMAEATISEKFDKPFAIYDLSQFLGAASLFGEDLDFEFQHNHLTMKSGNRSLRYFFADPTMVKSTDKKINLPSIDAEFDLGEAQLNEILKASSILGVPEIAITNEGDGGKTRVTAVDSKNSTSNSFDVTVDHTSEKKFKAIFKSENLKMIAGDYHVQICGKGISRFVNSKLGVEYFIAIEATSSFAS